MFLETITFLGDDCLLRIDDIECVFVSATQDSYQINIMMYGGDKHTEGFSDNEKLNTRYQEIKEILGAR